MIPTKGEVIVATPSARVGELKTNNEMKVEATTGNNAFMGSGTVVFATFEESNPYNWIPCCPF